MKRFEEIFHHHIANSCRQLTKMCVFKCHAPFICQSTEKATEFVISEEYIEIWTWIWTFFQQFNLATMGRQIRPKLLT